MVEGEYPLGAEDVTGASLDLPHDIPVLIVFLDPAPVAERHQGRMTYLRRDRFPENCETGRSRGTAQSTAGPAR
jgi:hypothetical protein